MAIILDGNIGLTYPDVTTQNTSAVIGGKLPTAKLPTGSVLQVLQAVKTDTASTSSTSFVDITGLSLSITPTSATSKFLVQLNIGGVGNTLNAVRFNLVRNGTNIAQPDSGTYKATIVPFPGTNTSVRGDSALWLDSPATSSAITYKVQWCVDGSTGYLNRHTGNTDYNSISAITVWEIAG